MVGKRAWRMEETFQSEGDVRNKAEHESEGMGRGSGETHCGYARGGVEIAIGKLVV
jgi:hypothetical protein